MPQSVAKSRLESALRKVSSLSALPFNATRKGELTECFTHAVVACSGFNNTVLARTLRHFTPLVADTAISTERRAQLRAELEGFITQIQKMSADELTRTKQP